MQQIQISVLAGGVTLTNVEMQCSAAVICYQTCLNVRSKTCTVVCTANILTRRLFCCQTHYKSYHGSFLLLPSHLLFRDLQSMSALQKIFGEFVHSVLRLKSTPQLYFSFHPTRVFVLWRTCNFAGACVILQKAAQHYRCEEKCAYCPFKKFKQRLADVLSWVSCLSFLKVTLWPCPKRPRHVWELMRPPEGEFAFLN